MTPIMDPRQGDLEDDASSTKHRSILSLAGTLLVEISLPRLMIAWVLLLIIPGLLLGAAPIGAWIWFSAAREQINYVALEFGSLVLLAIVVGVGWYGWRPLFRVAERAFWSLNSLIVQPIYSTFRETLRHLAEQWLPAGASAARSARLRAASAAFSGTIISGLAVLIILWVWPNTYLFYGIPDVGSVQHLTIIVLSNSVALISGYLAVAAAVSTIADVTMSQPRDLPAFHPRPHQGRTWRVAHLSDIHVVGERYGFRIESGRSGPQGNERWKQVLARLSDIHASEPLAAVLITGDVTDAGRSAEWAEFQDALAAGARMFEVAVARHAFAVRLRGRKSSERGRTKNPVPRRNGGRIQRAHPAIREDLGAQDRDRIWAGRGFGGARQEGRGGGACAGTVAAFRRVQQARQRLKRR